MLLLLHLWGCFSEHYLTYEIEREQIEYVYIQDNYVAGEEDVALPPIWVDSFQQPRLANGVDILWVIDGSGSMNDDAPQILGGIDDMLLNLPSISWRLMILSMTPNESVLNNSFPLLPGDNWNDATNMFYNNVQGNHEQGWAAVYEYLENNEWARNWLRDDAALLIVFVSDEEEQSNFIFPSTLAFSSYLNSIRDQVYISSIINLDPSESLCNGYSHNVGRRYVEITNLYGGQVIDICSADWSQGVADASNMLELRESYDLTNVPLDPADIYVFVDGQPFYDFTYKEAENRIVFDVVPPEESLVEIAYYY